jgi:hypothetical protein
MVVYQKKEKNSPHDAKHRRNQVSNDFEKNFLLDK